MKYWNNHRGMKLCLVGVFVISINPLGAFAANYYVATTGNNSNSGTIGSPFLTLEKAASVMSAGDTMSIRAGTYQRMDWDLNVPSGGGSWETATTVKAYNNEKVILTPQDPTQNGTDVIRLPAGKSWIIFDGLILDGLRNGSNNGGRMAFRFNISTGSPSHHIRIINTEMRNTYTNLVLTGNAHSNEFININFHHGGNNVVGSTTRAYAIYMESANNLVQGCDIHHMQGWGIQVYSGHAWQSDNNRFIGNLFRENERNGLHIGRGTGNIIINNLFYNNGTSIPSGYTGEERNGLDIRAGTNNTLIYNNTFYGNALYAIRIIGNNATVRNNIFHGTSAVHAVKVYTGSTGSVITNNIIYHANSSLRISNDGSATLADNSFANPFFVNAGSNDFRLTTGSPAIGKGSVLNEVKVDFNNVQRNQPYDIGAYAYVSSSLADTIPPASPRNVSIH